MFFLPVSACARPSSRQTFTYNSGNYCWLYISIARTFTTSHSMNSDDQGLPFWLCEQDKLFTCNVTWYAFALPLLPWESNKCYIFWVCVCSLRYPAFRANAPFCHLWPVRFCCIFPHYLLNGMIIGKRLLNIRCVSFSPQLLSETFLILRTTERYMIVNVRMSLCEVPGILVRFECNLNFIDRFSKNT